MSLMDSLLWKYGKIMNSNPKADKDLRTRQAIADSYINGMPLPQIMDKYSSHYTTLPVSGNPHRSVILFENGEDFDMVSRKDGSIMYKERNGVNQCLAITYDNESFQEDTEQYYGIGGK